MENFDIFISHTWDNKELAKNFFYLSISNGINVWYDESCLGDGDHLRDELEKGINASKTFLLLYSHKAGASENVKFEMAKAKEKHRSDPEFRLIVIILDDSRLPADWQPFIYSRWNINDIPGSIIRALQSIVNKKFNMQVEQAAFLNMLSSNINKNESSVLAEHTKNYLLYYMSHIKSFLYSIANYGYEQDLNDSIKTLLKLSLFEALPVINSGLMHIEPGVYEQIHATRMRSIPRIVVHGLPSKYKYKILYNDEVSTKIEFTDIKSGEPVLHAIPISIEFDVEL